MPTTNAIRAMNAATPAIMTPEMFSVFLVVTVPMGFEVAKGCDVVLGAVADDIPRLMEVMVDIGERSIRS